MDADILNYYLGISNDARYLLNRYRELVDVGYTAPQDDTEAVVYYRIVQAVFDSPRSSDTPDIDGLARQYPRYGIDLLRYARRMKEKEDEVQYDSPSSVVGWS